ncbi:Membrane-anchored ribosome-binding protein, ElaB/YqjD/DUF883 family [Cyclonatronum proteinivorum]|uniref:Membrane-anchored ribosome-binding protein, ElaB/YqjD/DUF883 family n=1 Tax=Cyclonatronum proteinivorum TaxID=1457365 RepID=A0A345ULN3_9BACT|nr:hypothetical protein [Cyclonatronum proteinivorum]AXJ01385.1 Membrane-anchored ribosome-binding protein, ElaB/YqjD/DUF883 family [Cyclonatronum proteinivorum]
MENKVSETVNSVLDKTGYDEKIKALSDEKERLERELYKEYRNARRYVRTNPEQGVGFAVLGGVVLGFLVAKLFD